MNTSNVVDLEPRLRKLEGVAPPGGGGDNTGMEARIAKLEDFAQDTRERLTRVETKLDHIEQEVGQTKWWLIGATLTIILTVIGTVVGTGIGIQQMTVTTFQAASQQAQPTPQPVVINVPATPPAN